MVVPLLAFALLAASSSDARALPRAKSGDETEFGIEVARRGLWNEARFRFEKAVALEQQGAFDKAREAYETALKLEPGNLYIQQNYDLFREADDKRNRKSRKSKP